jgi:catechol 2,3-dioxygenase-like lactoylglutathione lyase family enzyme
MYPTEKGHDGRVAIVIGGSRSTGRVLARDLASHGYAVVISYIEEQRTAEAAVEEILATHGTAIAIRADLADPFDIERLFSETIEAFGRVDVVVQAPGQLILGPAAAERTSELSRWSNALVNFRGRWQPGEPADIAELLTWLIADPGIDQGHPQARRAAQRATVTPSTKPMEVTMSVTDMKSETASQVPHSGAVDMKLEVVVLPVSDVDRAKRFYQSLGWRLDADLARGDAFRVVQLTPPGSQASIIFGNGITSAVPGSTESLLLAVHDIDAARAELVSHGVVVSEVFHDDGGVFHRAGTEGRVAGPDPDRRSYASWASFSDPDGNGWLLQEIRTRLPGR